MYVCIYTYIFYGLCKHKSHNYCWLYLGKFTVFRKKANSCPPSVYGDIRPVILQIYHLLDTCSENTEFFLYLILCQCVFWLILTPDVILLWNRSFWIINQKFVSHDYTKHKLSFCLLFGDIFPLILMNYRKFLSSSQRWSTWTSFNYTRK